MKIYGWAIIIHNAKSSVDSKSQEKIFQKNPLHGTLKLLVISKWKWSVCSTRKDLIWCLLFVKGEKCFEEVKKEGMHLYCATA